MKKLSTMNAKKITFAICLIFVIIGIIHVGLCYIALLNDPTTSFPAWAAFYLPGMYYLIPLFIFLGLCIDFVVKSKR